MIPQIQDAIDQYSALPPSPERDRAIRLLQNQMKVLMGDKTAAVAAPLQVASRIAAINQQLRTLDPKSVEAQDLIAEKKRWHADTVNPFRLICNSNVSFDSKMDEIRTCFIYLHKLSQLSVFPYVLKSGYVKYILFEYGII